MRRKKTDGSSPFRGVSLKCGRWLAQLKSAGFYRRFDSELEAFAHYIRAFILQNKDSKKVGRLLAQNRPWLGRIALEEMKHFSLDGPGGSIRYRFPVDRDPNHVVYLAEEDYEKYKEIYWYVKDGRVVTVNDCHKVDDELEFQYVFLDSVIYASKLNKPYCPERPHKVDGDEFNLMRWNLEPPLPPTKVKVRKPPLSPLLPQLQVKQQAVGDKAVEEVSVSKEEAIEKEPHPRLAGDGLPQSSRELGEQSDWEQDIELRR